jgi:hypothetical protein
MMPYLGSTTANCLWRLRHNTVKSYLQTEKSPNYSEALSLIGGFDPNQRGAGSSSAIAALVLAWLNRDSSNQEALLSAANALSSDTDTIATMTGAILGAVRPEPVPWPVQDEAYITREAQRLTRIGSGDRADSFPYPDLLHWKAPSNQNEAVGLFEDTFAVAGLGGACAKGEIWTVGDSEWQWLRLDFGQSILAKRKSKLPVLSERQLPLQHREQLGDDQQRIFTARGSKIQQSLPFMQEGSIDGDHARVSTDEGKRPEPASARDDLDALTDWVIRNNFEPEKIGRAFLKTLAGRSPVEGAMGFAAIIAKALLARRRREQSGR